MSKLNFDNILEDLKDEKFLSSNRDNITVDKEDFVKLNDFLHDNFSKELLNVAIACVYNSEASTTEQIKAIAGIFRSPAFFELQEGSKDKVALGYEIAKDFNPMQRALLFNSFLSNEKLLKLLGQNQDELWSAIKNDIAPSLLREYSPTDLLKPAYKTLDNVVKEGLYVVDDMISVFDWFDFQNSGGFWHISPETKTAGEISTLLYFMLSNTDILKEQMKNQQQDIQILIRETYKDSNYSNKQVLKQLTDQSFYDKLKSNDLEWIHSSFFDNYFSIFKTQYEVFSKTIISDMPGALYENKTNLKIGGRLKLKSVISNNDKYKEGITFATNPKYLDGKPLQLDDKTLIGYNIHFPKNIVKAILVEVYGGNKKNDREKKLEKPGGLDDLQKYLLNQGIAIVTLNLVDLLELDCFQARMPEELHKRLHASINKFFEVLKNNPESLAADLTQAAELRRLTDKDLYLEGGSFGGRTAVKHAELYPGSFNGYISFDGALSFNEEKNSLLNPQTKYNKFLCPTESKLQKLQEKVLVVHNFDDHNVPVTSAISFYKAALLKGKGNLINVWFNKKGAGEESNFKKDVQKGHYPPKQQKIFDEMAKVIKDFILYDRSDLSAITDWRMGKMEIYSDKYSKNSSVTDKFISEAFRAYKSGDDSKNLIKHPESWESFYQALYYAFAYPELLQTGDYVWYKGEKNRLQDKKIITDQVIDKAIRLNFDHFLQFARDNDVYIPTNLSFDDMSHKEYYYNFYRHWLSNKSGDFQARLIKDIFIANPELFENLYFHEFKAISSREADQAQAILLAKLQGDSNNTKALWHQVVDKIIHDANLEKLALAAIAADIDGIEVVGNVQ